MSFRIPTLDEARKKQEETRRASVEAALSTPLSQQYRHLQQKSSVSSSTTKSTSRPSASNATASTTQVKKPILNPYAKKKSTKVSVSNTKSSTDNRQSTSSSSLQTSNNQTAQRSTSSSSREIQINDQATSFSQAFNSIEKTDQYKKAQTASTSNNDQLFDIDETEFDFNTSNNTSTNVNNLISNRENHAFLQPHVLHVSTRQRGNRILNYIRNVPFEFSSMVPDYLMGAQTCALFLSSKYHTLNPQYVHRRIAELGKDFTCRVLLILVDMKDSTANNTILYLNKLAVLNNFTLILAFSEEEAARYLETYKAFEKKDASLISQHHQLNNKATTKSSSSSNNNNNNNNSSTSAKTRETLLADQITNVVTCIRSVNKTDSAQLVSQFKNMHGIVNASMEDLSSCPGIGEKKVRRLYEAFHKPFSSLAASKKKKKKLEEEKQKDGDEEQQKEADILNVVVSNKSDTTKKTSEINLEDNEEDQENGSNNDT